MKKLMILAALMALPLSGSAQLRLSQSQMMGQLPEGIIKEIPLPLRFNDENHLVLKSRAGKSYYVFDTETSKMKPYYGIKDDVPAVPEGLCDADCKNVTVSPDGKHVAYTRGNDLYSKEISTGKETRYTNDGSEVILNGRSSWVYNEEIFGRSMSYRAFWWSPDSRHIAFFRFDETSVPVFSTFSADGHTGTYTHWRYPKAGDPNPPARLGIVQTGRTGTVWADFEQSGDLYLGTPFWSPDGKTLVASSMPRSQKDLNMYRINLKDGSKSLIYHEHQDTFTPWTSEIRFTSKGFYFVRDFELWQHVYYVNFDGKGFSRITQGTNWDIDIVSVDDSYLYYTARREKTTVHQLFRVSLNRKHETRQLSLNEYDYSYVAVSPSGKRFAAVYSNCTTPDKVLVFDIATDQDWLVADARGDSFYKYNMGEATILFFSTMDGYRLPMKVIMPLGLDKSRKYPVHIDIYGGPEHTNVMDKWVNPSFSTQWWPNNGVIQVFLDNRSSGHAGKKGINSVYGHLGEFEARDYADAVNFLVEKYPFIDKNRIGIEGYSFGGTLAAYTVMKYGDVIPYGAAGGGVYDWTLYDSHYTERYMNTPQANPQGYGKAAVLNQLENYEGNESNMLFLEAGTLDDNVHFQNTLQLMEALQLSGKRFDLMIYPDQYHGCRGIQRDFSRREGLAFWYRYLLGRNLPKALE